MKSIKARLTAGYERLKDGRRFGRDSAQNYFAASELLARQFETTTITPQADAVTPLPPRLEDESRAGRLKRRRVHPSTRRERFFQRIFFRGFHFQPT